MDMALDRIQKWGKIIVGAVPVSSPFLGFSLLLPHTFGGKVILKCLEIFLFRTLTGLSDKVGCASNQKEMSVVLSSLSAL